MWHYIGHSDVAATDKRQKWLPSLSFTLAYARIAGLKQLLYDQRNGIRMHRSNSGAPICLLPFSLVRRVSRSACRWRLEA